MAVYSTCENMKRALRSLASDTISEDNMKDFTNRLPDSKYGLCLLLAGDYSFLISSYNRV
jgi:hypothetical protein